MGLPGVVPATAAGETDNALSRAFAERDPGQVAMLEGSLGAAALQSDCSRQAPQASD